MAPQLVGASMMNNASESFSANTFQWETTAEDEVAPVTSTSSDMHTPASLLSMMKATKTAKGPIKKRKRRPSPPKKTTELPEDFVPTNYSVLCGKGSENYNAIGNRRFRFTVSMFLEKYGNAKDRQEKSECVRMVMEIIQAACPQGGAFVTLKKGRWHNVDERTAREKVGAFFRDSLHEQYKSSAKSKIARRKHNRRSFSSSSSSGSVTSWSSDESTIY